MKPYPNVTLKVIGARWGVKPVTARRILKRHGHMGKKLGAAKSAAVRYHLEDVEKVERQAVINRSGPVQMGDPLTFPNLTLKEIGLRWGVDRTTARRILDRYGREAKKFGATRSASVRYSQHDVEEVERMSGERQ